MRLWPSRNGRALQSLDEAAAYARCHGERSSEILRVDPLPPPPPEEPPPPTRGITGESLRSAFEKRLRSR
ncbi:MAG: hypothetical protein ABI990_04600 [Actinomycetota bacterium]